MKQLLTFLTVTLFVLSGCVTPPGENLENEAESAMTADADSEQSTETTDEGAIPIAGSEAEMSQLQEDQLTAEELLAEPDTPLATRIIYFDYDSAKVRDDSLPTIESHGLFLAENGNVTVTLKGHTDERGSREYNIALGDRRAQSVRRMLLFQGASTDQVETVSYGEEEPAEMGHDEAAWSKNRRVELVYQVQ